MSSKSAKNHIAPFTLEEKQLLIMLSRSIQAEQAAELAYQKAAEDAYNTAYAEGLARKQKLLRNN